MGERIYRSAPPLHWPSIHSHGRGLLVLVRLTRVVVTLPTVNGIGTLIVFLIVDCDTLYVFTQYLYVSHNKFIFAPLLTSTCILQAVVRAQLSWLEAVRCVVHAVHESIDAVRHGLRTIQVTREETVYDAVMDIYQWENVVNLAEDLWHQPYRSRTRHT